MDRPIFPVLSLNRLAGIIGRPRSEISKVASVVEDYYVAGVLVSPKKCRQIHIPVDELRLIQRRILTRVLRDLSPHPSSFGGIKGRSALGNAQAHFNHRFIAKMDIRDFYPSVHYAWVQRYFEERHGCSPPVASILRRLLTFKRGLPQGTCTSPALADQIMGPIDNRILCALGPLGITYTRFVDDLTFSGDFSLPALSEKT
jgi:RNA-directed DNA polymerase